MPIYSVQYGDSRKSHTQTVQAESAEQVLSFWDRTANKSRGVRVERIDEHILSDRGNLTGLRPVYLPGPRWTTDKLCEFASESFNSMFIVVLSFALPLAILFVFIWLIKTIWYHV
jgi:hypothetical protein